MEQLALKEQPPAGQAVHAAAGEHRGAVQAVPQPPLRRPHIGQTQPRHVFGPVRGATRMRAAVFLALRGRRPPAGPASGGGKMADGLERVRVSAAELRDMVAAEARAAAAGGRGEGAAGAGGSVVGAGSL